MHFPVYLHIGPWLIPPHPVFEWLGCFLGARIYWVIRKRRQPLPARQGFWILVGTVVGAGVGSRLLAWFEDPPWLIRHMSNPHVWASGQTLVGALLGGLIGVEIAKKCVGWRESTGDAFVAPLIVGISVGRVGCFLAGLPDHTYGTQTNWITGVNFGEGIKRHPTQLYEIAFLLLLGAVLWALAAHAKHNDHAVAARADGGHGRPEGAIPSLSGLPNGLLFQLFMAGYLAFRLAVEFIKPTPHIYFGLSNIQLACVFGLAYYLPKLAMTWRRQKSTLALEAQYAK